MRRDGLGVLNGSAVFQVGRYPCAPKRVTAGALRQTCLFRPSLYRRPHIVAVHRAVSKHSMPVQAAKERPLLILPEICSFEALIRVSVNLLYGFGQIIVQSFRRDSVDVRGALVEDAVTIDREASATPTA